MLESILFLIALPDAPKVTPEVNSTAALNISEPTLSVTPAASSSEIVGMSPAELEIAKKNLTARVCGSPAVDGCVGGKAAGRDLGGGFMNKQPQDHCI